MTWKTVNNGDAGDSTHFGGNDIDKFSNLLSGVSNVDTVSINSSWTFQNGKLVINGEKYNINPQTSNYSITSNDSVILCDATSGSFTVTLPTAIGITGQLFSITKADVTPTTSLNANAVYLNTISGQTINQVGTNQTNVQWVLSRRGASIQVYSDGTNWKVLNYNETGQSGCDPLAVGTTLNRWYTTIGVNGTALTTASVVPGTEYFIPILFSKVTTLNKIGVNSTTGGTSSSLRLCIYFDNGNGYMGNLVTGSDTGAITSTATGQLVSIFGSPITLQPGLYWLGTGQTSSPAILSGFAVAQMDPAVLGFSNANPPLPAFGWTATRTYGAFPTTYNGTSPVLMTAAPLPAIFVQAVA